VQTGDYETQDQPCLAVIRIRLTWAGAVLAVFAIGWPVGDLLYRDGFHSPDTWWVLVLTSLAIWITIPILLGQEQALAKMDRLEERLDTYGDQRESDGARSAIKIMIQNGHRSTARQLHPVE
jgi:hypothetical protein